MTFKLGMTVDLYSWHIIILIMLIRMTVTLMQGHSALAEETFSVESSGQLAISMLD